ncbi:hypothetical protein HOY82DRAFT_414351 [Tuber indicum]|nr:hypothetical protein HOY82DRAFT_414351 [Tuber indicum]
MSKIPQIPWDSSIIRTNIHNSRPTSLPPLVCPYVRPTHLLDERTIITILYRSNPYNKHGLFPAAQAHSHPFVGGTMAVVLCCVPYSTICIYLILRGQSVSQSGLFPDLNFTISPPASSAFPSEHYYLLYPPPINILSDFLCSSPRLGGV